MRVPAFIFPTTLADNPNMLTRFGRLAYWVGIAGAALLGLVGALAVSSNPDVDSRSVWLGCGIAAALAFVVGRVIRYVIGGE